MVGNRLRPIVGLLLMLHIAYMEATGMEGKMYDVRKYGAKSDAKTVNTKAINSAIADCAANGGGTVIVPKGIFVTGTLLLKDNVRLYLQKDAVIKATTALDEYQSYVPSQNLRKYDSGDGSQNANSSRDPYWNRALILGQGIGNFSIEGEGSIDGMHLFDPKGEEKMRGPHTIIIGESRNFTLSGITINHAANYAFMAYSIENAVFQNLSVNEGWDGIHIRGGKNVTIRNCEFQTGDDAIAGGFWENMVITDCRINSSCNGIRMIMPAKGLTISNCVFKGPGKYPHRTSKDLKRNNMLSAIILQPGGWGKSTGDMEDIHIFDIKIDMLNNPLMIVLNEGNNARNILVERLKATNINYAAASIESWRGGVFDNVVLRDITINYVGNNDPALRELKPKQPPADSRPLPAWGWYMKNVQNVVFQNVDLNFSGKEVRPAFWFSNVGKVEFINVKYPGSDKQESLVLENSGTIIQKQLQ